MTGRELIRAIYAAADGADRILDCEVHVTIAVDGLGLDDADLIVSLSHAEYDGPALGILIVGDPA